MRKPAEASWAWYLPRRVLGFFGLALRRDIVVLSDAFGRAQERVAELETERTYRQLRAMVDNEGLSGGLPFTPKAGARPTKPS